MRRLRRLAVLGLAALAFAAPRARAEPPRPCGHLSGVVVDEEGRPVPGALVEVFACPHGGYEHAWAGVALPRPEDASWDGVPAPAPLAFATTDGIGRWKAEGLDPAARMRVRVQPAIGRSSAPVVLHPGSPWDAVTLVSRPDAEVRVRVVDPEGAPLRADVVARSRVASGIERPVRIDYARTEADGRTRLSGLPRGRVPIDVHVPGRALLRTALVVPEEEEVLFRVGDPEGAVAAGTVLDAKGQPVAGARVAIGTHVARENEEDPQTILLARTDATGAWSVRGLPPGVHMGVSVRAPGFVPITDVDARRPVGRNESLRYDLVLPPGGVAEGVVLGPDGKPFAGARVWIDDEATTTDGEGRWRLAGLGTGPREVRVRAPGLHLPDSPAETRTETAGGAWIDVRAEGTRAPPLRLRAGVRVEGRVVDDEGRPVRGAWVEASSDDAGRADSEPGIEAACAWTDEDGRFVLEGLVPGDDWTLRARTARLGADAFPHSVLRDEGRPVRVDLVLRRLGGLSGSVVDLAGKPAPGVEIALEGPESRTVRTDAAGRFAAPGVLPGAYRLTPTYDERRNAAKPVTTAFVNGGEETSDLVFTLDPPRALSGTVVDEKGAPAAGVGVQLKADEPFEFADRWRGEESWWSWEAVTDARGRFRFENLAPGGYLVRPRREDGGSLVRAGDEGVRLVWWRDAVPRKGGSETFRRGWGRWEIEGDRIPLEGRVLDPQGNPVPRALAAVTVHAGGGSQGHTAPVVDGIFRTTVPSRAETVEVEAAGAQDASGAPLDLAPSERTSHDARVGRVEVRLKPGRSLAGRVLDPAGDPVAGALVVAGPARKDEWSFGGDRRGVTDADGAFRIVGLPEGTVHVETRPGERWLRASATTAAGSSDLVLRLRPAAWIAGRVVDEAGRPLPGIGVVAGTPRTHTSFDGTFRLGPIDGSADVKAPERWVHRFSGIEYPEYGPVERKGVPAGTTDLELRVVRLARVSGVVVGEDGKPVRAEIVLEPEPADPSRAAVRGEQGGIDAEDAGFDLDAPPGRWRLTATTDDWNGRDRLRESASVSVTSPASGLRIVVAGAPSIRGRLVGADAGGFRVTFVSGAPSRSEVGGTATKDGGTFRWRTVQPGPFLVHASRPGDPRFALVEAAVPGGPPLEVVLREGRTIGGRLVGLASPIDPSRVSVWARSARGLLAHGVVDADGTFSVRGLAADEPWTLEARALEGGSLRRAARADVPAGAADVALDFSPRPPR